MTDITTLAQFHIDSYASAASLGRDPTSSIPTIAAAYAKHYRPHWVSFTHGEVTPFSGPNTVTASSIAWLLERYRAGGVGTDVRLESSRVEKISDQSAVCWIKWMLVVPKKDGDGKLVEGKVEGDDADVIRFEDVYGFRRGESQEGFEGGWEYAIADLEISAVLGRNPEILGDGFPKVEEKE